MYAAEVSTWLVSPMAGLMTEAIVGGIAHHRVNLQYVANMYRDCNQTLLETAGWSEMPEKPTSFKESCCESHLHTPAQTQSLHAEPSINKKLSPSDDFLTGSLDACLSGLTAG